MYIYIHIYTYIYICIYIYIHIHINVNYTINRNCERAFRSDLPTKIKSLSFGELLTTNYFFWLFICTW